MNFSTLEGLAPFDLPLLSTFRYDGGGCSTTVEQLGEQDRERLGLLYRAIDDLAPSSSRQLDEALMGKEEAAAGIAAFSRPPLFDAALKFGRDSDWSNTALGKILHDVRGGALHVLVGYADLELDDEDIRTCLSMARDHAKMTRNAFVDIDPEKREEDERLHIHSLGDYLSKWHDRVIPIGERRVKVDVDNRFEGYYSDRCLETSAVDRVVYNLTNNAARFALEDNIRLTTFLTGEGVVRWVFSNRISADHQAWLAENVGDNLSHLFAGGVTRGGSGIGLSSCATFVANAFGISSPQAAVDSGYLGARVVEDHFCAWFHWPAYEPQPGDPTCGCAHE